jgi:hypothetical protein
MSTLQYINDTTTAEWQHDWWVAFQNANGTKRVWKEDAPSYAPDRGERCFVTLTDEMNDEDVEKSEELFGSWLCIAMGDDCAHAVEIPYMQFYTLTEEQCQWLEENVGDGYNDEF